MYGLLVVLLPLIIIWTRTEQSTIRAEQWRRRRRRRWLLFPYFHEGNQIIKHNYALWKIQFAGGDVPFRMRYSTYTQEFVPRSYPVRVIDGLPKLLDPFHFLFLSHGWWKWEYILLNGEGIGTIKSWVFRAMKNQFENVAPETINKCVTRPSGLHVDVQWIYIRIRKTWGRQRHSIKNSRLIRIEQLRSAWIRSVCECCGWWCWARAASGRFHSNPKMVNTDFRVFTRATSHCVVAGHSVVNGKYTHTHTQSHHCLQFSFCKSQNSKDYHKLIPKSFRFSLVFA